MRGSKCMTEALAVRAELADLGVYRISCGHVQKWYIPPDLGDLMCLGRQGLLV
jgi:hypothetical protein